ncbi:DUF4317 domain-containing protein [Eubacterium sp.]|uniref:DUF4317 domain-containing protein n=1 Tax=Eubacterium sp. TaxID=142586 RepID=UPI003AB3EF32
MNKKEVTEIKKLFTKERCCLNRLCGCYVDADKNKVVQFKEAFLSLPEEEIYKYLDIFRKSLSGTLGKNLLNMEFPLEQEMGEGTQKSLMALRDSELKDDTMLDAFYDRIIETYYHPENYLILLVHGSYDIPMKTSDGLEMDDASDYIYNFVLCCLCPVTLSKAGLCYNAETNSIEDRIRDWLVDMPEQGFLFPAFQDRNTDIHRLLYYSKNTKELCPDITEQLLGCVQPIPAPQQKESFQTIIEDTLGEECVYDVVRNIHENLNEMIEEQKESGEPLELDKMQVRKLLERSGAPEENLEQFEKQYDEEIGAQMTVMANNISDTRKFEVKTPQMTVKVSPEQAGLVETRMIDGVPCLVIPLTDEVEVNGIHVHLKDEEVLKALEQSAEEE